MKYTTSIYSSCYFKVNWHSWTSTTWPVAIWTAGIGPRGVLSTLRQTGLIWFPEVHPSSQPTSMYITTCKGKKQVFTLKNTGIGSYQYLAIDRILETGQYILGAPFQSESSWVLSTAIKARMSTTLQLMQKRTIYSISGSMTSSQYIQ